MQTATSANGLRLAAQYAKPAPSMETNPRTVKWSELTHLGIWAASHLRALRSGTAKKLSRTRVAGWNGLAGVMVAIDPSQVIVVASNRFHSIVKRLA